MNSTDPFWRRPRIFDPRIGERRLFWNELTDQQKFEELNYHAYANKLLLRKLRDTRTRHEHS